MNIRWLRMAEKNVEQLADYIAKDNKTAAYNMILKIRRAANLLKSNPLLGRVGRVEGTRELIIPGTPFILPYRIQNNEIQILRVFHTAQEFPEEFN